MIAYIPIFGIVCGIMAVGAFVTDYFNFWGWW